MTKLRFIMSLNEKLAGLPKAEIEERLTFYSEMIEDRMEEGLTEEEAVASVGSVEDIAAQILADAPLGNNDTEANKPKRRLKTWEITLLILGSPIWLSLLVAAFSVAVSVYCAWWSVIISLWAVFVSAVACAVCGFVTGFCFAFTGKALVGIAMLGAGLFLAGLSVFMFFGCSAATNGTVSFTKYMVQRIKGLIRKEEIR